MAIIFGTPRSEKGFIAVGISFIFVGSLFLMILILIFIIQPSGLDLFASSIILIIFASIFIIIGVIFIAKRKALLERLLAKGDTLFRN